MLQTKIGFIGGGAIAEALINGMIKSGLIKSDRILVSDISNDRLAYLKNTFGLAVCNDNKTVAEQVDLLFLSIKPQVADQVIKDLKTAVKEKTIIVSVVAGFTIDRLQAMLPNIPIVRVMPNTPVAVGAGMAAISLGTFADSQAGDLVAKIFASSGEVVMVDEKVMDGVTGLSGSGPGYGFLIIEALADAGVKVGLPRKTSLILAAQTLLGAAKMVLDTTEHPAKLRDMVTSPAGTTITGIHVLEQRGVRAAIIDAVIAATERSKELGTKL